MTFLKRLRSLLTSYKTPAGMLVTFDSSADPSACLRLRPLSMVVINGAAYRVANADTSKLELMPVTFDAEGFVYTVAARPIVIPWERVRTLHITQKVL